MKNSNPDIIIVGAGLVGMTMACSVAAKGFEVCVIEFADLDKIRAKASDGRTCAVSYGSSQIFDKIGIWEDLQKHGGKINDIRIVDGESPLFLHYDHKIIGDNPMGHIIENYHIREALFNKAKTLDNLQIIAPAKYTNIEFSQTGVSVELEDGRNIKAQLLIAADGRNSRVRELCNIKSTSWPYKQTGIVCTAWHEKNHNNTAIEKFLPAGPFAILPMKGGHHSSIVWTEPDNLAKLFMQMDEAEFLEHFQSRFGDFLGELKITSPRFSYPLSFNLAHTYTSQRMALIGDAAHGMHPIAGQGFNLGIRDVPVLTKLITDAKNTGLDIGKPSILQSYEELRKFDNVSLLSVTDSLNRLFSNNNFALKHARRIGISAINKAPKLKKFFMKHAMGQ